MAVHAKSKDWENVPGVTRVPWPCIWTASSVELRCRLLTLLAHDDVKLSPPLSWPRWSPDAFSQRFNIQYKRWTQPLDGLRKDINVCIAWMQLLLLCTYIQCFDSGPGTFCVELFSLCLCGFHTDTKRSSHQEEILPVEHDKLVVLGKNTNLEW